ncbi:unnamed protein product [Cuscuta campestris]|uniref:cytokinin riboside 5'-monophosphate phosphoribohydrolase n=1 Tax=Cuscuta campestris TaxID=132261 RepID=A0A484KA33_9ASTE|nr:unnamed protein product [Cuscuta campestris]
MEGTSQALSYTIRFVGLLGCHALGSNPRFMAIAVDLGRELVRRKIRLTYGGGNVGLQGAVASTVYNNGGRVRGFIPGYIATRQVYGPTYGVEYTVSSNYYKYFEMNHIVEAFIVLPGGIDTMEGLFTLISWASEGLHSKPIGLLNIDSYFNNLIKFLDDAVRQNFMALNQRKLFISSFFVANPAHQHRPGYIPISPKLQTALYCMVDCHQRLDPGRHPDGFVPSHEVLRVHELLGECVRALGHASILDHPQEQQIPRHGIFLRKILETSIRVYVGLRPLPINDEQTLRHFIRIASREYDVVEVFIIVSKDDEDEGHGNPCFVQPMEQPSSSNFAQNIESDPDDPTYAALSTEDEEGTEDEEDISSEERDYCNENWREVKSLEDIVPATYKAISIEGFELLRKEAYEWWKRTDESAGTPKPWTWAHFEWAFKQEYIPKRFSEERRKEFVELQQGDMTLPEYRQKFTSLAKFSPTLVSTPTDRIEEFRKKLRPDLRSRVSVLTTVDFVEAYDLIARADIDLSACIEYLKTNNVGSSTHRPISSVSKGKRPFQESSNSHISKKGKSVKTHSGASENKSRGWKHPLCDTCGRHHLGESPVVSQLASARPAPSQRSTAGSNPAKNQSQQQGRAPARTYAMKARAEENPDVIQGHQFSANLVELPYKEFDIILGMDWLTEHQAIIDCRRRAIQLKSGEGKSIEVGRMNDWLIPGNRRGETVVVGY